jgi:hypothetical protein
MNKEKFKIRLNLIGILLCLVTIISLIDYRGLSFFQGFILKTTLTLCSAILITDLIQLDTVKKKMAQWKLLLPDHKHD